MSLSSLGGAQQISSSGVNRSKRGVVRCVADVLSRKNALCDDDTRQRLSKISESGVPEIVVQPHPSGGFMIHTLGNTFAQAPEFVIHAQCEQLVLASQIVAELREQIMNPRTDMSRYYCLNHAVSKKTGASFGTYPVHSKLEPLWEAISTLMAKKKHVNVAEIRISDDKFSPFFGCAHCGKQCKKASLKACGKCGKIHYCSRECQVLDWKAVHRLVCAHVIVH